MDIEFIGISGRASSPSLGVQTFRKNFVHELDIAILKKNISNGRRPTFRDIYLAVECKNTQNFGKSILKQILGIRRELSFLLVRELFFLPISFFHRYNINKITHRWINQYPPTEFWIYSSNSLVNSLQHVGNFWGLKFKYLNI